MEDGSHRNLIIQAAYPLELEVKVREDFTIMEKLVEMESTSRCRRFQQREGHM